MTALALKLALSAVASTYLTAPAAPVPGDDVAACVMSQYGDLLAGRSFLKRPLRVTYTDADPYADASGDPSFDAMSCDVLDNAHLYVYALGTTATLPADVNRAQRVVHDVMDHVRTRSGFGFIGELRATAAACERCPALARFYCSEIIGQAATFLHTGVFPLQRIVVGAERAFASARRVLASDVLRLQ